MLNFEDQLKQIIDSKYDSILRTLENKTHGFFDSSLFSKIHLEYPNSVTLTINTDGVQIFRKGHIDAWPFYMTVNELEMDEKFKVKNIIFPAIWMGHRKISNLVVLNMLFHEISLLERGIDIEQRGLFRIFCIYGSFDKPARAIILNCQSSNATYGCVFCKSKSIHRNKKCWYQLESSHSYKTQDHIKASMIQATQQNKPVKGYKGHSPLR